MSDTQTEEENRTIKTSVVEGIVEEIIEEVIKTVETQTNNGYWDVDQTNHVEGDGEIIEIVSHQQRGDTNDKQEKPHLPFQL